MAMAQRKEHGQVAEYSGTKLNVSGPSAIACAPSPLSLLDHSKENCVIGPEKRKLTVPSLDALFAFAVPRTTVLKPEPVIVMKPATALETESGPTVMLPGASPWMLEILAANWPADASTSHIWKERFVTGEVKL